eukprot:gnl/TRDRNA2_/TRDRNA2_163927_c0_seq2.p1 gnl/TRDRNA2_/TRDRNA2_163927_c0~~gnl/TRDRNA2_/TRDRNA2_163927_c0_seq2.p1  ORF type:complete len:227 (+),score=40.96 gnl/TRDRNA2_/TRDRNA2_163927_c0_seq2:176-856(+)
MEAISDPTDQRSVLRRIRRKAGGLAASEEDLRPWWMEATVENMEKKFREMERQMEKMGLFQYEASGFSELTGVDESELWIDPEKALELHMNSQILMLDSRNTSDYDVSRAKGALSLPGHTMEQLQNIERNVVFQLVVGDPEKVVVVYSDNGSQMSRCVHVARALRAHERIDARRVLRLRGGLNAWKMLGQPVDGDPRTLFAGQALNASGMRLMGPGGKAAGKGGYA